MLQDSGQTRASWKLLPTIARGIAMMRRPAIIATPVEEQLQRKHKIVELTRVRGACGERAGCSMRSICRGLEHRHACEDAASGGDGRIVAIADGGHRHKQHPPTRGEVGHTIGVVGVIPGYVQQKR